MKVNLVITSYRDDNDDDADHDVDAAACWTLITHAVV